MKDQPDLLSQVVQLSHNDKVMGLSTQLPSGVTVVCELVGEHWLPLYGLKENRPRYKLPPCFALSDEAEAGLTTEYNDKVRRGKIIR